MTLVFRVTLDDDQAHQIYLRLRPHAAPTARTPRKRVSNNAVRSTLAPLLRLHCDHQIATWLAEVPR